MKQLFAYFKETDTRWRYIWFFIFFSFVTLDAFFPNFFGVTLLKLLGIALCVIYVMQKYRSDHFLLIAFIFTFIADLLLTFNSTSYFGIYVFMLAQMFHFSRFNSFSKNKAMIFVFAISVIFLVAVALYPYTIYILGAGYAFFLIGNFYSAYKWHTTARGRLKRMAYYAFCGFLLFLCCDVCAACSFFASIQVLPFGLKRLFDFFCWFFYYPSQVLLSNSSKKLPDKDYL